MAPLRQISTAAAMMAALHVSAADNGARLGPPNPCSDPIVDWSSQSRTAEHLRIGLSEENFERIDNAMSCLNASSRRFAGGEAASSAIYWAFRLKRPALGTSDDQARRAAAWARQIRSIFAEFAGLRQSYDAAWALRGAGAAESVGDQKFKAFYDELGALEDRLLAASPELRSTAIWHNLLLATVLDEQRPRSDPNLVFADAVRRWPLYFDFQDVMLSRLVPRWGGSWPEVDRFIDKWSRNVGATEGGSFYALMYVSILRRGYAPGETLLDQHRMSESLREWLRRYPTVENLNIAASAACAIGDARLFKDAYGQLAETQVTPATWLYQAQRSPCVLKYRS